MTSGGSLILLQQLSNQRINWAHAPCKGNIMGSFSIWHWLIVLVIVMLVFGTKKLRNIGSDLGGAVRGFKDGVKDGTSDKPAEAPGSSQKMDGNVIEGEIKEKSKSA